MSRPFEGVINIDIRDSVPDWAPYMQPVVPQGAPQRPVHVLDDQPDEEKNLEWWVTKVVADQTGRKITECQATAGPGHNS